MPASEPGRGASCNAPRIAPVFYTSRSASSRGGLTPRAVERHPDRVSGAWVFRGTRVPVAALFENLESGARLEEFLEWFPGVAREQAEAVLEHAAPAWA
jgi:uncharacterized protein (DUF433 family)